MNTIRKIAVIGAGTMGRGIAAVFAAKGYDVALFSRSEPTLAGARAHLEQSALPASYTTDLGSCLSNADIVVESIAEDLELKRLLFSKIEAIVHRDCLLTTNTSSVPITSIAVALKDPSRLIGAHWFNPPEVMPLVELVLGKETSGEVVERTSALIKSLGKETITVRNDVPGFVINRLQYAMLREAIHLVETGVASVRDVDRAVETTLAPRWSSAGPLRLMDLAGLDVVEKVSQVLMGELSNQTEVPRTVTELVGTQALGVKSGRGFYDWTEEDATATRAYRDETVRLLTQRRMQ